MLVTSPVRLAFVVTVEAFPVNAPTKAVLVIVPAAERFTIVPLAPAALLVAAATSAVLEATFAALAPPTNATVDALPMLVTSPVRLALVVTVATLPVVDPDEPLTLPVRLPRNVVL